VFVLEVSQLGTSSPNGRCVATNLRDGDTIKLWEIGPATGK
jgi:hypothetical protein